MSTPGEDDLHRILAWALGLSPGRLTRVLAAASADPAWPCRALDALERLRAGEDLFDLLGSTVFWGRTFRSDARTCAVRSYVEVFVREILACRGGRPTRALDLGCGAGAVLHTLALELDGVFVGSDLSLAALALARENGRSLGSPAHLIQADLLAALDGPFDIVFANLPFEIPGPEDDGIDVRWEPAVALYDPTGEELGLLHRLFATIPSRLAPDGLLFIGTPGGIPVRGEAIRFEDEVVGYRLNARQAEESFNGSP